MFCGRCGNPLQTGNSFCNVCGLTIPAAQASAANAGSVEHWQEIFAEPKTDNKAIASLVFGCFFFLLPSALLAIILGHLSLSEIRKSAGRMKGRGQAVAGLVLGYLGISVIPILFVAIVVTVLPAIRSNRAYPNAHVQTGTREPYAISSIRAINTSEIGFQIAHPEIGYSCKLDELVGPDAMYGWRDPELANGQKDGYVFVIRNCQSGKPSGPKTKYQITAVPINKQLGLRAFCSDESGNLRYDASGSGEKCQKNGPPL